MVLIRRAPQHPLLVSGILDSADFLRDLSITVGDIISFPEICGCEVLKPRADDRLTARLGQALFSIQAMKGVEFGMGFEVARRLGSEVHDPIVLDRERDCFTRTSNNAGGLEGGMTTGLPLVATVAMKPIPTLMRPLATVNMDTLEVADASKERSDVCAVPAAAVVAEGEVAFVLANAYQEMFGGSCMADIKANLKSYKARLRTMSR